MSQRKAQPNPARRNEHSRRAILAAALELVAEVGYAKLSIEGIAARAGVGKQTIYRWWPSKGAVLFDAFLQLVGVGQDSTPALPDTGDVKADLKAVLRATVVELIDPRYDVPMRALNTEIMHDPALAAAYVERLDEPMKQVKRQRLLTARRAGQLRDDLDIDIAIDMLWGPLLNRWLCRAGPLTTAYADALVDAAIDGLRPSSAVD